MCMLLISCIMLADSVLPIIPISFPTPLLLSAGLLLPPFHFPPLLHPLPCSSHESHLIPFPPLLPLSIFFHLSPFPGFSWLPMGFISPLLLPLLILASLRQCLP